MARLLLIVEQAWPVSDWMRPVYRLTDRPHLILAPGIEVCSGERFKPGDRLRLVRPDGSTLEARLGGFSETGYNRPRHGGWAQYDNAIIVADLAPEDVPVGTEVYSADRRPRTSGLGEAEARPVSSISTGSCVTLDDRVRALGETFGDRLDRGLLAHAGTYCNVGEYFYCLG